MFDVIERLKTEWTDRFVVVTSTAPELARFAHATGIVKTVNMNGRCLVQFDQFNNIGWYDIDPAALKIVTEPRPRPAVKEPTTAAAPAKPTAGKTSSAKPAAGRPATADILAAARGKAGGTAPSVGAAGAEKPVASAGKLSTAEIIARARAAQTAAAPPAKPSAKQQVEGGATQEKPAPEVAPAAVGTPPAKAAAAGPLPTTTAEKIAWCRRHDARS